MRQSSRIVFLDNLKVFLTCLVIVHHTGQAYGPTGGFWYYTSPDRIGWLGSFFLMNASFFMGLFFFLSGYFMPGAFDRRGAGRFVKDRLLRFGLPLLFAFFVMLPYEMYVYHLLKGDSPGFPAYYVHAYLGAGDRIPGFSTVGDRELSYGHLWYVLHLLVYSFVYALFRLARGRKAAAPRTPSFPKWWAILACVLALGVVTSVVRNPLGYKIDRWVIFFGFFAAEVAHLPQYLLFFVLGVLAFRRGWIDALKPGVCYVFFAAGVGVVLYYWIGRYAIGGSVFRHWELKEAVLAVGFLLGLVALFKSRFNSAGALLSEASGSAYAAYVFHVPFVLSFQVLFHPLPILAKFLIVSCLGILASFGAGAAVRKLPFMRKVL